MRTTEKVWKSGDSLVITLRGAVREGLAIKEGDLVNIDVEKVEQK